MAKDVESRLFGDDLAHRLFGVANPLGVCQFRAMFELFVDHVQVHESAENDLHLVAVGVLIGDLGGMAEGFCFGVSLLG